MGWGWGSGIEAWRTVLYLCEFVNPVDVVVWCVFTGTGAGREELEAPDVGFVGQSVEVFERLGIEGLVVSCCRDCDFVGEVPEGFLFGVLPVRGVVLGVAVVKTT